MVDKLNLPFPILSDPDRSLSIEPYRLLNTEDPRGLAVPATVVIDPNGDEVLRLVSRDFADRPFEDVALDALKDLGLAPVEQPAPTILLPDERQCRLGISASTSEVQNSGRRRSGSVPAP